MEVEDGWSAGRWSQEVPSSGVISRRSSARHDVPMVASVDLGSKGGCEGCRSAAFPAVEAAYVGHLECLKYLHSQGLVLECVDESGSTPLHAAAEGGRLECAVFLVDRTGAELRARDKIGNTPAHHAVFQGHFKLLKFLVETGTGVGDSTQDGSSLMHYAAARGQLQCLQWLCSAAVGGNPNEVDANGATPLYFAAQEGHEACVEWLMNYCDADPIHPTVDGMCALHAAAQAGRLGCLSFMTRHLRKRISIIRDNDGATCMHFAAAKGHAACLRLLLQLPGCTGEEQDKSGCTPAHDAAEHGHLQCLRVLKQQGVDLKMADKEGVAPSVLAHRNRHEECVRLIEGHSADGNEELDLLQDLQDLSGMELPETKGAAGLQGLFAGRGVGDTDSIVQGDFGWEATAVPTLHRDDSSRYRQKKGEEAKGSPVAGKSRWRFFGKKK